MLGNDIRNAFLKFFERKGHTIVQSSSLVPHDDPTILFTNAGMNQFKGCFLGGDKRSYTRATTAQKCMRISGKHNDFENVGVTARHNTFFEMLGNFSFGDYFKKDAIAYAWEFITKDLALSPELLWVTVYEKDDEAAELWHTVAGVSRDRILRMTEKDNFWAMGDTGPCGPCSEIYYYVGNDPKNQNEAEFRKDDGTYLEFWNLVFMQYDRQADGKLVPLPKPSVDTGMGLERISLILQNAAGNYETDLLRPVISCCEKLSGFKYTNGSYAIKNLREDKEYARNVAMRVIADHSRSAAFLIADGVMPASDGRGYVLRRLIRRAARHGKVLEFKQPFFAETTAEVIKIFGKAYPELKENAATIAKVVEAEEQKFYETLDSGITILQREVEKLKADEMFPGETAFLLYDTYGFPIDLTEDALKPYKKTVDLEAYERAMQAQRTRSRDERKSQGITFTTKTVNGAATKFIGYTDLQAKAKLTDIFTEESGVVGLVFDATPFYGESGGQVGDSGEIRFKDVNLSVLDTQKTPTGHFIHYCKVATGNFSEKLKGSEAELIVDANLRHKTTLHHSATHVLHTALRKTFGAHVKQAGSKVSATGLRFDYSHFETPTEAELEEVLSFVGSYLRKNFEISTKEMALDQAKKLGATALFGEKYGTTVRVVEIGPESLELCGGTHAKRSGDVGAFIIQHEGAISSGVRRIECAVAASADSLIANQQRTLQKISSLLNSESSDSPERIEKLFERIKRLEREIDGLRAQSTAASASSLLENARVSNSGIKVVIEKVPPSDIDTLKAMVDQMRVKLGSGVVALASTQGDTAVLVAGSTSDLHKSLNMGNAVKEAAKVSGGKGGGRADFAQAGGIDPAKVDLALEQFFKMI